MKWLWKDRVAPLERQRKARRGIQGPVVPAPAWNACKGAWRRFPAGPQGRPRLEIKFWEESQKQLVFYLEKFDHWHSLTYLLLCLSGQRSVGELCFFFSSPWRFRIVIHRHNNFTLNIMSSRDIKHPRFTTCRWLGQDQDVELEDTEE